MSFAIGPMVHVLMAIYRRPTMIRIYVWRRSRLYTLLIVNVTVVMKWNKWDQHTGWETEEALFCLSLKDCQRWWTSSFVRCAKQSNVRCTTQSSCIVFSQSTWQSIHSEFFVFHWQERHWETSLAHQSFPPCHRCCIHSCGWCLVCHLHWTTGWTRLHMATNDSFDAEWSRSITE